MLACLFMLACTAVLSAREYTQLACTDVLKPSVLKAAPDPYAAGADGKRGERRRRRLTRRRRPEASGAEASGAEASGAEASGAEARG
jgi:hypothetical protein